MNEYKITITETLQKTVTVEAESREEAEQKVNDAWRRAEYILDAEDFPPRLALYQSDPARSSWQQ